VVDEVRPDDDKGFKKVRTYLSRARECALAEWAKNETLKKQWNEEKEKMRETSNMTPGQL